MELNFNNGMATKTEQRGSQVVIVVSANNINYQYAVYEDNEIYLECPDCQIKERAFKLDNSNKKTAQNIIKHYRKTRNMNAGMSCPNCKRKLF